MTPHEKLVEELAEVIRLCRAERRDNETIARDVLTALAKSETAREIVAEALKNETIRYPGHLADIGLRALGGQP